MLHNTRRPPRFTAMSSSSDTLREILLPLLLLFISFRSVESHETSLLREMKAECNKDGITVKLWFRQPFNGVAYSYGYHDKEKCRYIGSDENQPTPIKNPINNSTTNFSFLIPANDCGTEYRESPENSKADALMAGTTANQHLKKRRNRNPEEANEIYIENTLLIQKDPAIQEAGDLAQRLRCVWRKEILKPLVASFPFGNSNRRSPDPINLSSKIKSGVEPYSYYRRSANSNSTKEMGITRFPSKGQVQNIPYSSYRRKSSRSLPITEADRRRDELIANAEKNGDKHNEKIAMRLEGHFDYLRSGADGWRSLLTVFITPFLICVTLL